MIQNQAGRQSVVDGVERGKEVWRKRMNEDRIC